MKVTAEAMKTVFRLTHEYVQLIVDKITSRISRDADAWAAMEWAFQKSTLIAEHPGAAERDNVRAALEVLHESFDLDAAGCSAETLQAQHQSLKAGCLGLNLVRDQPGMDLLKAYVGQRYKDAEVAEIVAVAAHWLLAWGSNAQVERDVKLIRDCTAGKFRCGNEYIEDMVLLKAYLPRLSIDTELPRGPTGVAFGVGPFLTELYHQWDSLRKSGSLLTKQHNGAVVERKLSFSSGQELPPRPSPVSSTRVPYLKRLPPHLREEAVAKKLRADYYAAQDVLAEPPSACPPEDHLSINWDDFE